MGNQITNPMIYLASNSPRRAELLTQIGVTFTRIQADVEECLQPDELAAQYVTRLATEKAQAGFLNSTQDRPVLGADTIVVREKHILEKPCDQKHAHEMMKKLSATTHQVLTAIAVVDNEQTKCILVQTSVTFKTLSDQEIRDYWETGEPCDKAGGYGIQGVGGKFVTHISGSYSAVVGLPLYETDQLIKEFLKENTNVS